jgi:Rod binding domain-containing protein
MKANELNSLPPPAAAAKAPAASPPGKPGDAAAFADALRLSLDRKAMPGTRAEQIKAAANQLVSVAFIKPMLTQMRQSPFKNEMFGGGQGAEIFQEHLDTVLADRMAMRTTFSIADAAYKRIAGPTAEPARQATVQNNRINRNG